MTTTTWTTWINRDDLVARLKTLQEERATLFHPFRSEPDLIQAGELNTLRIVLKLIMEAPVRHTTICHGDLSEGEDEDKEDGA